MIWVMRCSTDNGSIGVRSSTSADSHHASTVTQRPQLSAIDNIVRIISDIRGSTGHRYHLRDSRGVTMDCLRIISAPIDGAKVRYLGVYHYHEPTLKSFEVYLAQSFNLLQWEFIRRLVPNADMPALAVDATTGSVLLVYEQFGAAHSQWPSSIGCRMYRSVADLVGGKLSSLYVAPNLLSELEGTPTVRHWDARGGTAQIDFHFQNRSGLRDEAASGALTGFPQDPRWTAAARPEYTALFTAAGALGNVGGRSVFRLDGVTFILQEGNLQPPPGFPTTWTEWRIFLLQPSLGGVKRIAIRTHANSTAVGNPAVEVVPSPTRRGGLSLFVTYFLFGQGAAKGEGGPLAFYYDLPLQKR